jgi:hypothetical protein
MRRASWMSFGIIVTRLAWIAHRLVSLKRANQIGLTRVLQSTNSCALEAQICFEVLRNFSHQTLEGEFASQKFGGLLIASISPERRNTRPGSMRFLHPSGRGRALASGFCSQLCPGRFSAGGLAGGLRSRRHGTGGGWLTPSPSAGSASQTPRWRWRAAAAVSFLLLLLLV